TDARRLRGDPGEEDLRRAHVRVPTQAVVLDRPDAVEPHLFGIDRLLDAVAKDLALVRGARVGHLRLEDHRELHRSLPTKPATRPPPASPPATRPPACSSGSSRSRRTQPS